MNWNAENTPVGLIVIVQSILYWVFYIPVRMMCKINLPLNKLDLHKKPFVIASSHVAIRDPFVVTVALPWKEYRRMLPIRFMTKDSYVNPLWKKPFMLPGGCFPAEKGNNPNGADKAVKYLKKDQTVFIFPEGKINRYNEPLQARSGIYYILENARELTLILVKVRRNGWGFNITFNPSLVGKQSYISMLKKHNIMEKIHDLDPTDHPFVAVTAQIGKE